MVNEYSFKTAFFILFSNIQHFMLCNPVLSITLKLSQKQETKTVFESLLQKGAFTII